MEDVIDYFNLKMVLSNSRTSICENEEMRICFDKNNIVRVVLYDDSNLETLEKLRKYFYENNKIKQEVNMKNLEITKDNYKGYVKLFKAKMDNAVLDKNYCGNEIKKITKLYPIFFLLTILPIFIVPSLLTLIYTGIIGLTLIATICGVNNYYRKKDNKSNNNFELIKQEYPYIENYNFIDLIKSLENAKVIVWDRGFCNNIKEYEKNIPCEEVKEKYLDGVKHDYSNIIIENTLTEETKEKVKVKTKKYMNRSK